MVRLTLMLRLKLTGPRSPKGAVRATLPKVYAGIALAKALKLI